MSEVNLIYENLWDHYSGLPNPAWYQYKKKLNDEEEDTDSSIDLGVIDEEVQTQKKKYMGLMIIFYNL